MSDESSLRWSDSKKRKREDGPARIDIDTPNDAGRKEGEGSSDEDSPSRGSIPLEVIKQSDDYSRKVTYTDAPKRKYAVAIAYLGTAYRGLQINPGILTVEAVLEKALYLAGGIEECNFGEFHKLSWSRAGRTDKGVHAVTNCCSMNLRIPLGQEAAFINNVNSFLPEDIRVLTMTKTIKNFSAKLYCDGRLYRYLLPTYVLTRADELNAVFGMALENCEDEKVKNGLAMMTTEESSSIRGALLGHRLSADGLKEFRDILSRLQGTHKFHNFTSDKSPTDASVKRYIISVECSEPMLFGDSLVEWVCISLRGQSFLLNQVGTCGAFETCLANTFSLCKCGSRFVK